MVKQITGAREDVETVIMKGVFDLLMKEVS
jgi:hypothetical protein